MRRPYYKAWKDYRTDPSDPFPTGLKGKAAEIFLQRGLPMFDGGESDDVVKCKMVRVAAEDLKPIQLQIYFDKVVADVSRNGLKGSRAFYTDASKTILIASSDNWIIDGHHRWLGANLIDPRMKLNVLRVALPLKSLLPLALAYGDAIGNERNQ